MEKEGRRVEKTEGWGVRVKREEEGRRGIKGGI